VDQIFIQDLMVRGVIGISDHERSERQNIVLNIVLFTDIREAAIHDDINLCVNYRTVAKSIIAFVESSNRYTVEALAEDIAQICLNQPAVSAVKVKVEKPGAVRFSKSVGVEIERSNQSD